MLMLLSPAKKLDYASASAFETHTHPELLDHAKDLISGLQKLSPHDVCGLMSLSNKLGALNYERFQAWQPPFSAANARQAVLAFQGDVYQGLEAGNMSSDDLHWAQNHLRILSGLYGLLRPLDLMQPYRLEMSTKFATARGANLYQFWGGIITDNINRCLCNADSGKGGPVLVNLASNEYFKSVQPKDLKATIITPVFMDCKNGEYKVISFHAKRARGLMAAFAIKNRILEVDQLKRFDSGGYYYQKKRSTEDKWVFTRD